VAQDRTQILEHFPRRNAKRPYPAQRKPGIARVVPGGTIPTRMRFSIHFDRQPQGVAIEVEHIGTGGMLTPKFQTRRALPQFLPK